MEVDVAGLNFSKLGETKVTVPLILILAVAVGAYKAESFTIALLDEVFFTDAAAADLVDAIEANTDVLSSYIQRQDIRDVNDQIEDIGDQITETQLWIAANETNPIATDRLTDLVKRRRRLEERKDCLLNDNIIDKGICDA